MVSRMTRITLRLPDQLHHGLQQRARRSGTSLNEAIVGAIRQALNGREVASSGPDVAYERQAIELALQGLLAELQPIPPSMDHDQKTVRENIPSLTPPLSS